MSLLSTDRPKVAVVITRLGIPSEVWALRQARAFTRLDPVLLAWDVDPVGGRPADLDNRLIDAPFAAPATLPRKLLRKLGRPEALALSARQKRAIAQAVQESGAQLVLCHFAWTAIAVAQAVPDLPVVWHVHGRDVSALMASASYQAMLRRHLPKAAGVIAVGQHQIDRLTPFGLPPRQALIPCGAPLDLFAARALPAQTPGAPVRFISVGRMSQEKGMIESFRAFEIVARTLPGAELVLIGDGPVLEELRAMVLASTVAGQVRLTGLLPPEAIAAELSQAQVYLQHSREVGGWVEGFGVTLTEAGAAGLPLVASASGGLIDQIEDGENGLLFPADDIVAQAQAMITLGQEPVRRAAMGAVARRLAQRFDSAAMAARLEDELCACLPVSSTIAKGAAT